MSLLENMRVFVRVVEQDSMSAAGRLLRLSPAVVSHRIQTLESHLGVRLLNRTTRRVQPTDQGLAFYRACQEVLAAVERAETVVAGDSGAPQGSLRITAPLGFARRVLAPLVPEFQALHPKVTLQLRCSEHIIDLLTESVDVALRMAIHSDSSLISRKIVDCERLLCAAPAYLSDKGTPRQPQDLHDHNCLLLRFPGSQQFRWTLRTPDGPQALSVQGGFDADDGDLLTGWALDGRGIVLIERRNPPFGWAIPGGFVEYGETVEEAAIREAHGEAVSTLVLAADLTVEREVTFLFESVRSAYGRLDVLFNNAGAGLPPTNVDLMELGDWRRIVDINLNAMFHVSRDAFRMMAAQEPQGGRIVNNGSVSAASPRPGSVAYTATKHAVTGLTKSLSLDGRASSIAAGQIDYGNVVSAISAGMAVGMPQPDGSVRYRMFYTLAVGTKNPDVRIDQEKHCAVCHSDDGIRWTDHRLILSPRPDVADEDIAVAAPFVWRDGDRYRMLYCGIGTRWGYYSISQAVSRDGDRWDRGEGDNLTLAPDEGSAWESQMVEYPCVIAEKDRLRLFYCGNGYGATGIGTALSVPLA